MNKRLLWLLIGAMTITLVGLILVQAYWIKSSIRMQRQQFGNLVNEALAGVVKRLDAEETMFHISNEVVDYGHDTLIRSESHTFSKSQLQNGQAGFNISITESEEGELQGKQEFYVKSRDSLLYYNSEPIVPNDKVRNTEAARAVQKRLASISDPMERSRFIQRVMNRMVSMNTRIEERISKKALHNIVKKELRNKGVFMPFEFAIHNRVNGIMHKSNNFDHKSHDPIYTTRLSYADYLTEANFLSIQFRNEQDMLRTSLNLMTYSSILLTLIVIVIFAVTVFVIFKQKKMSEIRVDFVNNMTHEFKTPISTISLASQMLKDDSIPDEMKNTGGIAKIIEDESKRLLIQVEKVLQTAVFEKGKLKLKPKDININELVQSIVQNFSIHVEKKNGKLLHELSASKPMVYADEMHLRNIIVNLLDNAMKYTKAVPEIRVCTKDKRNALQIAVSDNGVGIAKNDAKHIFDQFYRVSTGNRHDIKGFGLGLSYVKKIVDAHGGVIKVESEVGKGTTFKILLPRDDE